MILLPNDLANHFWIAIDENMVLSPVIRFFVFVKVLLAMSLMGHAQSLEAESNPRTGWAEFRPGLHPEIHGEQIALLHSPQGALRSSSEGPQAGPEFVLDGNFPSDEDMGALDIAHEYQSDDVFAFGNLTFALKPKTQEAKIIAQIINGQRPWPSAIPNVLRDTLAEIYADRNSAPYGLMPTDGAQVLMQPFIKWPTQKSTD